MKSTRVAVAAALTLLLATPRVHAQRASLQVQVRSQDHAAGSIVLRGYRLDGESGGRTVRMSKTGLLTKAPSFELRA